MSQLDTSVANDRAIRRVIITDAGIRRPKLLPLAASDSRRGGGRSGHRAETLCDSRGCRSARLLCPAFLPRTASDWSLLPWQSSAPPASGEPDDGLGSIESDGV